MKKCLDCLGWINRLNNGHKSGCKRGVKLTSKDERVKQGLNVKKRQIEKYIASQNRARSQTYWNYEPCKARVVMVVVGESPRPTWWCAKLVGTTREAVEVVYCDQKFYLDNEGNRGWNKVTLGKGSPGINHRSLPVKEVLE